MRFTQDLHMHTKYSDGRATVEEMMLAGIGKGLEKIAITDHGPNNIGVGVRSPERLLDTKIEAEGLSKENPIEVLVGVEADITGLAGEIDVPAAIYRQLDMLLVGLHPHVLPHDLEGGYAFLVPNQIYRTASLLRDKVINNNTKAVVEVLQRHPVDILTHPGLKMPIDYQEVARACARTGTWYEINTGHAAEHFQTPATISRVYAEGVDFVVNSDAHFPDTVGELDAGWSLLQQAGVSQENVVNVIH